MSDDQSQQRKGEGEERQRSGAKEGDGDEEEEEEGRAEEERRRAEAQVGAWGEYWGDGGAGAPLHPRCLWEVPHSLPLVTWDHGTALLRHHPDHVRLPSPPRFRFRFRSSAMHSPGRGGFGLRGWLGLCSVDK
jgi:hypothetical protein